MCISNLTSCIVVGCKSFYTEILPKQKKEPIENINKTHSIEAG